VPRPCHLSVLVTALPQFVADVSFCIRCPFVQANASKRDVRDVLSSLSPTVASVALFAKPETVDYFRFELRGSHVGLKVVELAECPIGHLVVSGFRPGAGVVGCVRLACTPAPVVHVLVVACGCAPTTIPAAPLCPTTPPIGTVCAPSGPSYHTGGRQPHAARRRTPICVTVPVPSMHWHDPDNGLPAVVSLALAPRRPHSTLTPLPGHPHPLFALLQRQMLRRLPQRKLGSVWGTAWWPSMISWLLSCPTRTW
jgi:hypothetical protein